MVMFEALDSASATSGLLSSRLTSEERLSFPARTEVRLAGAVSSCALAATIANAAPKNCLNCMMSASLV